VESEYIEDEIGLVSQGDQAEGGHGQAYQYDGCLASDNHPQNKGHADEEYQCGEDECQEIEEVGLDIQGSL